MELLVFGLIGLAALWMISKGKGADASITVQAQDSTAAVSQPVAPRMLPPVFGVAQCGPDLHTCQPAVSQVPIMQNPDTLPNAWPGLAAGSVSDSMVNGVDQFAATGGISPSVGGGDTLVSESANGSQIWQRPNGDRYQKWKTPA